MAKLTAADWDARYRSGDTPWDLSGPTPEFQLLTTESWFPRKGRALVPGGGRGHDAILLAKSGLAVDLIDFSPIALQEALKEASQNKVVIHAYCRDFFTLPESGYHQQAYDLFLEYTFFCAIDPQQRKAYVEAAATLLKPGAYFIGLFFPLTSEKEGPPFVVSREEIETLFSPFFHLQISEPKSSVKPRADRELLGIFRRK